MKIPVLLAQFPVSLSISANLQTILSLMERAETGDILLLPEGAISGYAPDLSFLGDLDLGELKSALDELRFQAQRQGIHLWVGTCLHEDGQWFNTAFGFTPSGSAYQYRKINLANHERTFLTPGSDLPVFDLELKGGTVKVGVQICREIRYPEQWGWLARKGAQVILHLNNAVNDSRYMPVWRSHLVSHAASNQRFVISANNADLQQNSPTIAVSPDGWVIDEIVSDQLAFTRVKLDLSQVSNDHLDQSRPDIVSIEVPNKKERRRIMRSMRMEKLQRDLDELQAKPGLFEEQNLGDRTEALEFIGMIEDMYRLRSRDRDTQYLHQQALALRERLDYINSRLFSQLRDRIKLGDYTPAALRTYFKTYTDYQPESPGQPHYGYENLDGLITGVFATRPVPKETLERLPGMIRYQPTPASVILELIDQVGFSSNDVFFDLGSGLGQVLALVNLLTGVRCIGIEYQPEYSTYAARMVSELGFKDITLVNADVQDVDFSEGTVFFLFNPFGGRIFDTVMNHLEIEARVRKITICSYGACTEPISRFPWLEIQDSNTVHDFKLAIFKSKHHLDSSPLY